MDNFTKNLKTKYKRLLDGGGDKDTLRDRFIWEIMEHDLPHADDMNDSIAAPWDIYNYLLEDEKMDCSDVSINLGHGFYRSGRWQQLDVRISSAHRLTLESTLLELRIALDDNCLLLKEVRNLDAGELAEWIVRQKQNLDVYMAEWDSVVNDVAKKAKTRRLVVQAVKALATEALRPYPNVQFEVFEQSRRVKVMVRFLNSNLGLNIYAYYGSYKKTLPPQLDDLKRIIEVLSHNVHKTFFTYSA